MLRSVFIFFSLTVLVTPVFSQEPRRPLWVVFHEDTLHQAERIAAQKIFEKSKAGWLDLDFPSQRFPYREATMSQGTVEFLMRPPTVRLSWAPRGRIQADIEFDTIEIIMKFDELRFKYDGEERRCTENSLRWISGDRKGARIRWFREMGLERGRTKQYGTPDIHWDIQSREFNYRGKCIGGPSFIRSIAENLVEDFIWSHWGEFFTAFVQTLLETHESHWMDMFPFQLGNLNLHHVRVHEKTWFACLSVWEYADCRTIPEWDTVLARPGNFKWIVSPDMAFQLLGEVLGSTQGGVHWSTDQAPKELQSMLTVESFAEFFPDIRKLELPDDTPMRVTLDGVWKGRVSFKESTGVGVQLSPLNVVFQARTEDIVGFTVAPLMEGRVFSSQIPRPFYAVKLSTFDLHGKDVHSAKLSDPKLNFELLSDQLKMTVELLGSLGLSNMPNGRIQKLQTLGADWLSVEFAPKFQP